MKLFRGCFAVLAASAFGFVFRSFHMDGWGTQFGLSKFHDPLFQIKGRI